MKKIEQYTAKQLKVIEGKITKAIKSITKCGYKIRSGDFGVTWVKRKIPGFKKLNWAPTHNCVCPMGAVLLTSQTKFSNKWCDEIAEVSKSLKVKIDFVEGFVGAFDGNIYIRNFDERAKNLCWKQGYDLGAKLRKQLKIK